VDPTSARNIAAQAAKGFSLLKCHECAEAIRTALVAAGHNGQLIELRAMDNKPYLVCLSFECGLTPITQNGRHLGVRVGDLVFDNLHPDGMLYDEWLQDFDARTGVKIHSVTEF
jgi:hypothetical protein